MIKIQGSYKTNKTKHFQQVLKSFSDKWTFNVTKLFISTRLGMEKEFGEGKRKRSVLWGTVLRKMKDVEGNIKFSVTDLMKKYNNMMITYRRIKKRNTESGMGSTSWEFYEEFNSAYGARHSIQVPVDNTISTLETNENQHTYDSVSEPARKKIASNTDILEYLKEQNIEEKQRHDELMAIEREKIKVEREKTKILQEIKELIHNCN